MPPSAALGPGRTAVVTGAAAGIGRAIVRALTGRGMNVVLADRDAEKLDEAVRELGEGVRGVVCDVADGDAVAGLREAALHAFGRVDILCSNAGVVAPFAPIWAHDEQSWKRVLDVNLWGVIHGMRAFVPHFVAQGHGHLVNIASMAGVTTIPFNGIYNASKHAVVSLTETLAAELEELAPGVGATVVCVGRVATGIGEEQRAQSSGMFVPREREGVARSTLVLDADRVAAMVIDAIEARRLHLFTHPDARPRMQARIDRLLMDLV